MDRKSIIILLLSFVLLMLWPVITAKWYPPKHVPAQTNQLASGTRELESTTNATPSTTNVGATAAPAAVTPPTRGLAIPAGAKEHLLTLTNADARYEFTS